MYLNRKRSYHNIVFLIFLVCFLNKYINIGTSACLNLWTYERNTLGRQETSKTLGLVHSKKDTGGKRDHKKRVSASFLSVAVMTGKFGNTKALTVKSR